MRLDADLFRAFEEALRVCLFWSGDHEQAREKLQALAHCLHRHSRKAAKAGTTTSIQDAKHAKDYRERIMALLGTSSRRMKPKHEAKREEGGRDRVPPTPETKAKLEGDVILELVQRGQLQHIHADAAMSILEMFETITKGQGAKAVTLEPSAGPIRDEEDPESDKFGKHYSEVYKPWANAMSAIPVAQSNVATRNVLALVFRVVIDRRTIYNVGSEFSLTGPDTIKVLHQGLEAYCVAAGWRRRGKGSGK